VKRTNKQYFVYYLKENILLFDVFDYLEEIAADYVDYCYEWHLIKEEFVCEKNKVIKDYINLYLTDALMKMNSISLKSNCKILCFYNKKHQLNKWYSFFSNPEKFIKTAKKILKNRLLNFIDVSETHDVFQNVKGTFEDIPCLIPSGEDEDFLLKIKKKLK
jgi:biotin synthase-like enzyme